jgi:hypothetical protein
MGMFDDITFDYRMPDGFDGYGYQTKDLDCACDAYEITPVGRLILTYSSGYSNDDVEKPLGDTNFKGELNIYTSSGFGSTRATHDYNLMFVDGNLAVIKCNITGVELVFDPVNVASLPKPAATA